MAKLSSYKGITQNGKPPTKHDLKFVKVMNDADAWAQELMNRPKTDRERQLYEWTIEFLRPKKK